MQKKQVFVIGIILIGAIVFFLVLTVLLKKKEDARTVFQTDVITNLKEGYSVKDTIFESLDDKNQHIVAVIHWESKDGLDQQDSLVVFELRGKKLTEIFNSTDWVLELGNGLNGDYVRAEDINKDNLKEFVVTRSQGGNCWTCSSLRVFQVKDHKVIEFLSNLPETQAIYGIMDLNSDDIKELIVLDAEWEVASGLCHACSPSVDLIYTWKKNNYEKSSTEFPFYYDEKIKELEKEIEERLHDKTFIDYYIGRSMAVFFNYIEKGEKEKGWKVFNNYLTEEKLKNFEAKSGYAYKIYLDLAQQILKDFHKRYIEHP